MQQHNVVSRNEWLAARKAHLAREKELTHLHDAVSAERRALPWMKVEKTYLFDSSTGPKSLDDLFGDKSQLIVNHFMLAPGWKEGCVGCSFGADHVEGTLVHLAQRDVAYVAVSRAPLAEIEAYKQRMGWHFDWVSSFGNDFNYDFHVSFTPEQLAARNAEYNYQMIDPGIEELPGYSVFAKNETGEVFHTYSAFARGGEALLGTYALLDMTPKGRDETLNGNLTDWVKRHDEYTNTGKAGACCHS
ncbi:MAG: thioredoxin family protein [Xanthobacteraceae bacterium]|nr:thioredoxin family protein [Hyphomicrobiales bacterium]